MAAPEGNTNAARGTRWRAAIERAIEAWPNPADSTGCNALMRGLNTAAHQFVAKMMTENDLGFFKEFGDRLDGKAVQQTVLTGDADNPVAVTEVRVGPL